MREFAYSIASSSLDTLLLIQLKVLERKNGVIRLLPLKEGVLFSEFKAISNPFEREAVLTLKQEEFLYQKTKEGRTPPLENFLFHIFHIPTLTSVLPILTNLATAQKLYFQDKQLILDLHTKVNMYYEIHALPSNQLQITGCLKWHEKSLPLEKACFIGKGTPHWFIQGVSLKMLPSILKGKTLDRLTSNQPWILEDTEKSLFLQQLEEAGLRDALIFQGETAKKILFQEISPLPLLILKDKQGAFAQLWMQYGQHKVLLQDSRTIIRDDKGAILFRRQLAEEKYWEKDLLETDFIHKLTVDTSYYCPLEKVSKSLSFLLDIGWLIQDYTGKKLVKHSKPQLFLEEKASHISVKGKIAYASHTVDLISIIGTFNKKERFLSLDNDTVGLVPSTWEDRSLKELSEAGEIVGNALSIPKYAFNSIATLIEENSYDSSEFLTALKAKKGQSFTPKETILSSSFKGELRPYQRHGVNWLHSLQEWGFHGILADDMGLGKTIQILAFLANQPSSLPHLIVMPTSLLFNWKKEIEIFLPEFTVWLHQGSQRELEAGAFTSFQIILTSYSTLRTNAPLFESHSFQTLVLDEAQVIKNPHTQIAQTLYRLKANFRLCLTGTPIENNLLELWSHFHFLMPQLLGSQQSFEREIDMARVDSRYLEKIKKKVHPFILRRRKKDVLEELPERIDQTIWVEMHARQKDLYEKMLRGFKTQLLKKVAVEGAKKHRIEIFEALLRLRQICCHPHLIPSYLEENENIAAYTSAKCEALFQDLDIIVQENRKVLVYSQFSSMLKIFAKYARERGWSYGYLDGSTKDRQKAVECFQEDPAQSIFFISLKAGGVGLNLTAADYVFIYDPWWNEAAEEQAISRTYRIGRKETIITKRFLTSESIEEKILKLKTQKKHLVENIIEESNTALEELSIEDLCLLFE